MAQGFDSLIEFLAGKVAFRGDQGARRRDILPWIREFYTDSSADEDSSIASALKPPPPLIDHDLANAVWSWLKKNDGLQCSKKSFLASDAPQEIAPDQHVDVDGSIALAADRDVVPSHPGTTSVVEEIVTADKHQMWLAIAGHDVDHKKLPVMHFQLLSIIAATGKAGTYQPQLIELSGQDKRSIPARTDFLHQKGYIEKRAVIWGKMRTSWCVCKAFSGVQTPLNKLGVDEKAMKARRMIEQTLPRFESSGEGSMLLVENIRQDLDIVGKRLDRQALNRAFNIMATFGWVKLYSVPTLAKGPQLKAITLLRKPSSDDLKTFERVFNDNAYLLNASANKAAAGAQDANHSADADADDEDLPSALDMSAGKAVQLGLPQGVGAWRPESSLPLQIFEQVNDAAQMGINAVDVSAIIGLGFCRKSLDQLFHRLAQDWKSCQPPSLRKYSIVRDVGLKYRSYHYVYRTFPNQVLAVQNGKSTWSAVGGNKVANERFSENKNGFEPIVKRDLVFQDAAALPAQCLTLFKANAEKSLTSRLAENLFIPRQYAHDPETSSRRMSRKAVYVDTSNPVEALQALKAKLPEQKQWKDFMKQTNKLASFWFHRNPPYKRVRDGTVDNPTDVPDAKRAKLSTSIPEPALPATHKQQTGKRPNSTISDDPQSHGPPTKKAKIDNGDTDKRALAELEMQLLMMTRPGAYINPPASIPASRGRPKKRLVLVVKTGSLNALEFFTAAPDIIPEIGSSQSVPFRDVGKIFKRFQQDSEVASTGMRPKHARVSVIERTKSQRDTETPVPRRPQLKDDVGPDILAEESVEAAALPETHDPAHLHVTAETNDMDRATNPTEARALGTVRGSFETHESAPAEDASQLQPVSNCSQDDRQALSPANEPDHSHLRRAFPLPNADRKQNPRRKRSIYERGFGAFAGGTMASQRKEIILFIINRNGGVYPGEREIGAAFAIEWQNRAGYDTPPPDTVTATKTVKNLVDSGTLLKHYFTVDYRGAVKTKSVLSIPSISGDDEKVKAVQDKINAVYPKSYIPERSTESLSSPQKPLSRHLSQGTHDTTEGQIDRYQRVISHRRSKTDAYRWHTMLRHITAMDDFKFEEQMLAIADLEAESDPQLKNQQSTFPLPRYIHDPAVIWSPRGDNPGKTGSSTLYSATASTTTNALPAMSRLTPAAERFASRRMRSRFQIEHNAWIIHADNKNGKALTLTSPTQTIHQPSGTFSTDYCVDLFRKPYASARQAHLSPSAEGSRWAHTERELSNQDQQSSLQDHPFDQINAIAKWEIASLAERNKLPSNKDTVEHSDFIVHSMPAFGTVPIAVGEPNAARDRALKLLQNLKLQTLRRQLQTRTRDLSVPPARSGSHAPTSTPLTSMRSIYQRPASGRPGPFSRLIRGIEPIRIALGGRGRRHGTTNASKESPFEQVKVSEDEAYRLAMCVVAIQSITGSKLHTLDWALVGKLTGNALAGDAKQRFKAVAAAKGAELKQLRTFFQVAFLAAYEHGEVPDMAHKILEPSDWQAVIDWAMDHLDEWLWPAPNILTADKKRVERCYTIGEAKDSLKNGPIMPRYLTMSRKKLEFNEMSFQVPLRQETQPERLANGPSEIEVAKTLIRANIKTPEESYSAEAAKEKLGAFAESTIDQALSELIKAKLLERKEKKKVVEGRNFTMTDAMEDAYLRLTVDKHEKLLSDSARIKSQLDAGALEALTQQLPFGLCDGDTMALIELFQAGYIRVQSILPMTSMDLTDSTKKLDNPAMLAMENEKRKLSIWGFTTSSYKTLHMSNDKLIFPLRVGILSGYKPGLLPPAQPQLVPPPSKLPNPEHEMVPLWRDINGNLIQRTWSNVLAGVATIVALRPGIKASEVVRMLDRKGAATEAEVQATIEWMMDQAIGVRHGNGYGVSGAWWSAVSASIDRHCPQDE